MQRLIRTAVPRWTCPVDPRRWTTRMTQLPDVPSAYPPPEISVSDITVSEGDSGIIQAIFSILRSGYLGSISAIGYTTADGSAVQPGDYASQSGTLVFEPNVDSLTVTVDVNGDTLSEADENFFLDLSDPLFAEIIDDQAQCTITNDDPLPGITIDDAALRKATAGLQHSPSQSTWMPPAGRRSALTFLRQMARLSNPAIICPLPEPSLSSLEILRKPSRSTSSEIFWTKLTRLSWWTWRTRLTPRSQTTRRSARSTTTTCQRRSRSQTQPSRKATAGR